uniref:Ribosomal protein L29 n=1 Tax=Apophlaea sinclairii TaxID=212746 RepID=A0A1C9CBW1_9FLOR|nr:ribosomal protein L29 [Apophlaea sinclairii]AOM65871.1 ribosomal protein L29 [Apophlaea sinclairii]
MDNIKQSTEHSKIKAIQQIIQLKRELFDLRLKKATKQSIKPHLFKQAKRNLARLLTQENQINIK